MRTIYGLLLVSLLMFLSGITFIVLAAKDAGKPIAAEPVASVKQLMQGVIIPASATVYNSVSTTITEKGTEEVFPRNDGEWENVASNAMVLIEAANMLKVEGRAKDDTDWGRMSDAMATAARQVVQATEKKDVEALLAAGEPLNNSCDNCHRRYETPVD